MQRQGNGPPSSKRSSPQQRPSGPGGGQQGQRSNNRSRNSGRGKHQDSRGRQQQGGRDGGQPKGKPQAPATQQPTAPRKLEPGVTPDGRSFGNVVESHKPKTYGCVFYDTFQQARADAQKLAELARGVDQLNIVIKAEGDMNDPELRSYGMLYAGAAWHLIHTRRIEEHWYDAPR